MKISYQNLEDLPEVAKKILKFAAEYKVWALAGEMGVGKTTLIQALGKELGVEDVIQSPTYALVHEYQTDQGGPIYHFDFYRIKSLEEVMDMGYEEYFYSGHYCWIEWASYIEELLPPHFLYIRLSREENNRVIELEAI